MITCIFLCGPSIKVESDTELQHQVSHFEAIQCSLLLGVYVLTNKSYTSGEEVLGHCNQIQSDLSTLNFKDESRKGVTYFFRVENMTINAE